MQILKTLLFVISILTCIQAFEVGKIPQTARRTTFNNPRTKPFTLLSLQDGLPSVHADIRTNEDLTMQNLTHRLQQSGSSLCDTSNTVNGTCTISDRTMRYTADYTYSTVNSIVIRNATIVCVNSAAVPCIVSITLKGANTTTFEMYNSTIFAKGIVLTATQSRVIIDADSKLNSSGSSRNVNGTQTSVQDGASYIGAGGTCGTNTVFKTYGEFDMRPQQTNYMLELSMTGSMGIAKNTNTTGGGRILIIADSIKLDGSGQRLTADAKPFSDANFTNDFAGGSGGYIYINTANLVNNNTISVDSSISAQGGFGQGKAYGGSGGVIVLDGNFTMPLAQMYVNGGSAFNQTQSCANGAAGTIYHALKDELTIDTKGVTSDKYTMIKVPARKSFGANLNSIIAKDFKLLANSIVRVQQETALGFSNLQMKTNSTLQVIAAKPINVYFQEDIVLDKNSTLDFSKTSQFVFNSNGQNSAIFGNIWYMQFAGIILKSVWFNGNVMLPTSSIQSSLIASKIYITSDKVSFNQGASIHSGFIMIQANTTLITQMGVKIQSYIQNTCNIDTSIRSELFNCVPKNSLKTLLNQKEFISAYNTQFKVNVTTVQDTINVISQNYTVYLAAFDGIRLQGTRIIGSRVGLCGGDVFVSSTTIDTSGKGCLSDSGIGKGLQVRACAGSGASHGGDGGYGGLNSTNTTLQAACTQSFPKAFYYGQEARYEGSGGGSGSKGGNTGGIGGGIIWISSNGTTTLLDSQFLAEGKNAQILNGTNATANAIGSGGGSGGSIQLTTNNLAGNSYASVKGGNGQLGGGGGAGGRIQVHFLRSFLAESYPNMTYEWAGQSNQTGGFSLSLNKTQSLHQLQQTAILQGGLGKTGTVLGQKCFGGFYGPFCTPCPAGTFKQDYSFSECMPCTNKPANAYYSAIAQNSSQCTYQCSNGVEPVGVNQFCENEFYIQINRFGGIVNTLIITNAFLFVCLIIWISLICRSKQIQRQLNLFNKKVYDDVLLTEDNSFEISEKECSQNDIALADREIWSHTHRMYLIGENSITYPWYITKDFPIKALEPDTRDELLKLIKHKQDTVGWNELEKNIYGAFRIFYPPFAPLVHNLYRQRHFNQLQRQLYNNFPASFWDERSNKTLRFSHSTSDNQLAYIDFLDFTKTRLNYQGPQLPITLLMAGSGTFNCPYYINFEDDALAKSLVYIHKECLKTKLPLFFENLNTLLSKLSFFKFWFLIQRDLKQIIEWVELGNKTLFNDQDVTATLYVFENTYTKVEGNGRNFRQQRRSFPLESFAFEAFPDMYINLVRFIQSKLLGKKSEIRLGLVFKPFCHEQKQKMIDRVKWLSEGQPAQNTPRVSSELQSSLLYAVEDQQDSISNISMAKTIDYGKTSHSRLHSEGSTSVFTSKGLSESQIYVGGSLKPQNVKIIDKSKRAFDLSKDSTLALELSIRKTRGGCYHRCSRARSFFYAQWLSMFKYHGSAPRQEGLYFLFLAYAIFLTVDILLLVNIIFHLFFPLSNLKSIAIPFLYIYPGVVILAPAFAVVASITGSARLFKAAASLNATCVAVNYPLTIIWMLCTKETAFYMIVVALLWVNKILLSYLGGKVRQHLLNPAFAKNETKIEERLYNLYHYENQIVAAGNAKINKALRASQLTSQEVPTAYRTADDAKLMVDDVDSDDDERDYGISSVADLRKKYKMSKSFEQDDDQMSNN